MDCTCFVWPRIEGYIHVYSLYVIGANRRNHSNHCCPTSEECIFWVESRCPKAQKHFVFGYFTAPPGVLLSPYHWAQVVLWVGSSFNGNPRFQFDSIPMEIIWPDTWSLSSDGLIISWLTVTCNLFGLYICGRCVAAGVCFNYIFNCIDFTGITEDNPAPFTYKKYRYILYCSIIVGITPITGTLSGNQTSQWTNPHLYIDKFPSEKHAYIYIYRVFLPCLSTRG
jgi:hypothetical protein